MATSSDRRPGWRAAIFAGSRLWVIFLVATVCGTVATSSSYAELFHSRNEGIALAFPTADRVTYRTRILTGQQVEAIEALAKAKLESKLVPIYTGWQGDRILGHVFLDIHIVRTKQEALLLLLDAEGRLQSLRMLAFYEPLDYLPTDRWFRLFEGKTLDEPVRPGRDIHAVVGSTLSTQAIAASVRRALAMYQVLVAPESLEAQRAAPEVDLSGL